MVLKFLGWSPAENSYVSQAGEVLFSLCWQSPKDGVSKKKILVVVQPYNKLAYNENNSKKSYCLVCHAGIKERIPH